MTLNLYDRVALKIPVPGHDVLPGDVATLLEFVDHPLGGARGCVLEFFNATGDSLRVITVPERAIEPLRSDEVFSVRPLASAN